MALEHLPTARLTELRDQAESNGDWERAERIEDELERRDYDADDPASPQNTATDARDNAIEWPSY